MPTTAQQLQQFNNLIPRLSATQIIEMMKQHGVAIDQLPALQQPENAEKLRAIKNAFEAETQRDQQARHAADWQVLQDRLADPALSLQQAKQLLQQFISQWEHVALNPSHVAEAQQKLKELNQQEHEADWQQLFQRVNGQIQPEQAMQALQQFIDKWQHVALNFSHVPEAQQKLKDFCKRQEENEWQQLILRKTIYDIPAYADHVKKWRAYGIEIHASEADDKAWEIVLLAADKLKAFLKYESAFPKGRHVPDGEPIREWPPISVSDNLVEVYQYLKKYSKSPYRDEARALFNNLKAAEIHKMQKQKEKYPLVNVLGFINEGIFTDAELIAAGVATQKWLRRIRNQTNNNPLPNLVQVAYACQTECAKERTDIYLFGVPSTGKTCVLMGLLQSGRLQPDLVRAGGKYAGHLRQYCIAGQLPPQTRENFVATIQAGIQEKQSKHEINLVELAGEDFAMKIASNQKGKVSFADMGDGVQKILVNGNRKVFFFIVDPTSDYATIVKNEEVKDEDGKTVLGQYNQPKTNRIEYHVHQPTSLQEMASMLDGKENDQNVLQYVDAIHFIVTKADVLGDNKEERQQRAKEILMSNPAYCQIIKTLTEICRKKGINQHPDKRLNGVPHLFTFSLGKFMPGGSFDYVSTDSDELVNIIAQCTQIRRGVSLWDRFCHVLSKPVI